MDVHFTLDKWTMKFTYPSIVQICFKPQYVYMATKEVSMSVTRVISLYTYTDFTGNQ